MRLSKDLNESSLSDCNSITLSYFRFNGCPKTVTWGCVLWWNAVGFSLALATPTYPAAFAVADPQTSWIDAASQHSAIGPRDRQQIRVPQSHQRGLTPLIFSNPIKEA